MKNSKQVLVFLVDDDVVFLTLLETEFRQNTDYVIQTFATGELCLEQLSQRPDIVVLDYYLNGIHKDAINGLDALDAIKAYNKDIQVIMLSAQDKIEVAVQCMHHQALDYVVKSETAFLRIQKIITAIQMYQHMEKQLNWYIARM
jgi:two-component system, OmpR family, response regulator